MLRRTILLALFISSWAGAQTRDYVMDMTAATQSRPSGIGVKAEKGYTASGILCKYHVTNGAAKPVFSFLVGAGSTDPATKGLPVPPVRRNEPSPGSTPAGWFESWGSGPTGYSQSWQAQTSKDLIQHGESRDFSLELPPVEGFECGAAQWTAHFAIVYPPIEFSPTELSITVSDLRRVSGGGFEGEVSIRNLGPNDAVLYLGETLGNGSRSYPNRLRLVARGPDGRVYNFAGEPFYVAGRMDPMVVPLLAGGAYSVHGRWYALGEGPHGTSVFHVEFEGAPARADSLGLRDVNLMRFWLGKIASNEVTLSAP